MAFPTSLFSLGLRVFQLMRNDPTTKARLHLLNLQTELARFEIAERMGLNLAPVQAAWSDILEVFFNDGFGVDHVILGDRGAGKTALGVRLAQEYASVGLVPQAFGMAEDAAAAVGLEVVSDVARSRGTVLVVDETGVAGIKPEILRDKVRQRMARARHDESVSVWIAQSGAHVPPEVFRFRGSLWVKRYDALASSFDREELGELLPQLIRLWSSGKYLDGPAGCVLQRDGGVYITENPLPEGWSEDVSVNRRGDEYDENDPISGLDIPQRRFGFGSRR